MGTRRPSKRAATVADLRPPAHEYLRIRWLYAVADDHDLGVVTVELQCRAAVPPDFELEVRPKRMMDTLASWRRAKSIGVPSLGTTFGENAEAALFR